MSSHSSHDDTFQVAAFLIFVGAGFIFHGLKRMSQSRKIEDSACSDIRSAPQGLVEIQGHALPGEGAGYQCLEGDPCVYRDLKIEKYVKRGKNSSWETVFTESEGNDFIVSDGTGIARIYTASAELILRENVRKWNGFTPQARENLGSRYGTHLSGLDLTGKFLGGLFMPEYRFTERVIRIASPVYARGVFQTVKEMKPYVLEPRYYRFLGELAELRKQTNWKQKAFDLDRDGKITEFEIDKGSEKLFYLAKGMVKPEDAPEAVTFQGLIRHAPEHGLLIGDSYQEILTARLRAKNMLRVVGGAAMVAAAVGLLITDLGR